ncbi:unnamed protein product [Soboliphyme baturini]|uniref:Alanine-glyoxylate aminotransferase 2 n=1 Tax=Soboliphyme baturini TaxID=241478 RepID=A0A183IAQ5_9BILA|nr:unnamed protein product [Soboliphyme baturini]
MGKPMGNGFPIGAVVTKREIAQHFGNGMEYFNTYGGNPVACAAALAVLQVMHDEKLQSNAEFTGTYLHSRLCWLQSLYPNIMGDVRY